MKDIFITSAVRTAVGSLGKSLKNISADVLGSAVITDAVNKSKIKNKEVDEIILGQVLTGGTGQNPARQAAIKSGIPIEKPAYIVNQVCGSGLRSVASAFQSIKSYETQNAQEACAVRGTLEFSRTLVQNPSPRICACQA